jgi:hypothetical protein
MQVLLVESAVLVYVMVHIDMNELNEALCTWETALQKMCSNMQYCK